MTILENGYGLLTSCWFSLQYYMINPIDPSLLGIMKNDTIYLDCFTVLITNIYNSQPSSL